MKKDTNKVNKDKNIHISKENSKIVIIILMIIAIVVVGTYALSLWTSSENTELTMRIGSVAEVVFETGNDINVSNIGPVFDPEKDGEITNFSVLNFTTEEIDICINFKVTSITDNLKNESFKYMLLANTEGTEYTKVKEGSFVNASNNSMVSLLDTYSLPIGDNVNFKLIIFIDGEMLNDNSIQGGSLNGYISVFTGGSPLQTLEILGLDDDVKSDNLTTFTGISTDTDTGIYKTQDDLGDSYYFRGNVTNNYVKFGKNSSNQDMYWRIIRINGDGTIRMIYDGTQAHQNGTSSTDRRVGTSAFNANYGDNAFVGYMNGTTNGTNFPSGGTSSTSYAEAHANITNSTIKTYLEGTSANNYQDGWYYQNIVATGYGDYVADAIYCNDRSISSGDGFGTSETYYNVYYGRYSSGTWNPTLICPQSNDKFTKEETLGNGKLTYPVGLITTDEVVFAGGYDANNTSYYLYTGNWYWTMSPSDFGSGRAYVLDVRSSGNADYANYVGSDFDGVRPVISLKGDAIKGGQGTANRPFTIEEETDLSPLQVLTKLGLDDDVKSDNLTTFTGISTDADTGIYKTQDDLGDSYYFRGNVTNNYVKFGKNSSNQDMYWRIIRINGDGTIRMIYDGTQAHDNGTSSTDRQVGISAFNTNYGDNAFVGYMNGTTNGTNFPSGGTSSTSYAEAHANITNSTIKTYLEGTSANNYQDGWYYQNIVATGYSDKVADAIYCNDRSISSGSGFGTSSTNYNTYYGRYSSGTWSPTLICPQANDKFTKEEALGNGKLTYPVGLITIDEVVFAGGHTSRNNTYYLYTGNSYWTMSPYFFYRGGASVLFVDSGGYASGANRVNGDRNGGVRPVLSLKSNAITGGTGAPGSPFTVS